MREFIPGSSIPKGALESVIDAARLAPTARNVQPWEFVVITDKDKLRKIADIADNGKFIVDAAACVAVFCKDTKYYLEDGSAATENLLLAATDMGLASCWVAGDKKPYAQAIKELLGVPLELKLISLIALGKAKSKEENIVPKRVLAELVHWDKF